jgi:hypothetical protein
MAGMWPSSKVSRTDLGPAAWYFGLMINLRLRGGGSSEIELHADEADVKCRFWPAGS